MTRKKLKLFENPYHGIEWEGSDYIPDNETNVGYGPILYDSNLPPQEQWLRWSTDRAVHDGLKASEWVYTSVTRIATAASSVPWRVYQKQQDGSRIPYKDVLGTEHPIEELLESPNPWLNGGDFFELMTQHLYLGGNFLSKSIMLGGVPVSLIPVMPDLVDVIAGNKALVDRYDVWQNRNITYKPAEKINAIEMLHIKFTDPSNFYWGISPLMAVAKTVDTDNEAVKWNKVSLQNRAVSDGAFVVNQAITKPQWEELRKMVREQHQGRKNAHNPWLLGYGMDWKSMSMTPLELDFINSRRMNRESILAVYNVPPPVAGLYDAATFNNLRTARLGFWLDTVIPYLDNVKAALTFFFKQFDGFGKDWILDYDLSGVEALKPELKEKVEAAKTLWQIGVPLNVLNTRFELDLPIDIPYADIPFVAGVKSAKDVVAGTPAPIVPINPNPTQTDTPTNTFSRPDVRTYEGRQEIWANSETHRKRYEQSILNVVVSQLQDDYDTIATAFAQDGRVPTLDSTRWHKNLLAVGTAIIIDAGNRTTDEIVSGAKKARFATAPKPFAIKKNVIQWLDTWVGTRSEEYDQTTLDDIDEIIKNGEENDMSPQEIASEIKDSGSLLETRGQTIAGTESVGLNNYGVTEAAKQSDIVSSKMWVSSGDERVRLTHDEADGQEVGLDESFSVGDAILEFPGDPSCDDASEIVNCRCTVTFTLNDGESQSNRRGIIVKNGKHYK